MKTDEILLLINALSQASPSLLTLILAASVLIAFVVMLVIAVRGKI